MKLKPIVLAFAATLTLASNAQASLEGRDLDGNAMTYEAYYDTVLDITWLADANYARTSGYDSDGKMSWSDAMTWAENLVVGNVDTWRLPTLSPLDSVAFSTGFTYGGMSDVGYNISAPGTMYAGSTASELAYMYYVNLGNMARYDISGVDTGCFVSASDSCLDNAGPFTNIQAANLSMWTDTSYPLDSTRAWSFRLGDGAQGHNPMSSERFAWAVASGDVAAIPEPETWAMMLAGLALVGYNLKRRRQN
jgi:hypothetical protein